MTEEKRFYVLGKVQGVFFRKSFVYWLESQSLLGGATNDSQEKNKVFCTILNIDDRQFLEVSQKLCSGKFNNMGAYVENIIAYDHKIEWQEHDSFTGESPSQLPFGIKLKV